RPRYDRRQLRDQCGGQSILPRTVHQSTNRSGFGDRHRSADCRGSGPDLQPPAVRRKEGLQMSGKTTNARKPGTMATLVVTLILIVIALVWTVPTIGVFVTSFRNSKDIF